MTFGARNTINDTLVVISQILIEWGNLFQSTLVIFNRLYGYFTVEKGKMDYYVIIDGLSSCC